MTFQEELNRYEDVIPKHYLEVLLSFHEGYQKSIGKERSDEHLFSTLLTLIKQECLHPFTFAAYHQSVRAPFDYYRFGLDFTKPLLHKDDSTLMNIQNLLRLKKQLAAGENVILLANHQTELDPQIICCLLEEQHADLAAQMIFVAGQKVITDLLAIPFSMGCNLLCIYSKRYIDLDPALKEQKQLHNQRTMKLMSSLLKEGGKCIYVAPSGGRDRTNAKGVVEVAPFDPDSIEMFRLMALQSKRKTHFYPLALSTYNVLPPPETIDKSIGERRIAARSAVHLSFADECDMDLNHLNPLVSKHERRKLLAQNIWAAVDCEHQKMLSI